MKQAYHVFAYYFGIMSWPDRGRVIAMIVWRLVVWFTIAVSLGYTAYSVGRMAL